MVPVAYLIAVGIVQRTLTVGGRITVPWAGSPGLVVMGGDS